MTIMETTSGMSAMPTRRKKFDLSRYEVSQGLTGKDWARQVQQHLHGFARIIFNSVVVGVVPFAV